MIIDEAPDSRARRLNNRPTGSGAYVLYWMQRAQRTTDNHALETALWAANELGLPLLVLFVITADYPEANLRHYRFMAEGLRDVASGLSERGIGFALRPGAPPEVAAAAADDAALVVTDGAYLRHLREWRRYVAERAPVATVEVETDIVVPVEITSQKREYAARTIRKRVMSRVDDYLDLPAPVTPAISSDALPVSVFDGVLDPTDPGALCDGLDLDRSVPAVSRFLEGGERAARSGFERFLAERAHRYAENRNEPAQSDTSYMSAYLHFGHVSPVWLVRRMRETAGDDGGVQDSLETFVEELVVRRELAQNYCYFEPAYDSYDALPQWARTTLAEHTGDARPAVYSRDELESAGTHDEYWNAAMREMRATGYMHNYMRMYWGKKVLEWSREPREAFEQLLYLNNRYFIDGRDPASYANVAWIFGLHDRAWPEREVFGKVRTMKSSGLERKFDMAGYLEKVRRLEKKYPQTC